MRHDDRITITIPFPSYIPFARGIYAVGKFGTKFKASCTFDEKELVTKALDELGITEAAFIRWVCVHVAKEILKGVEVPETIESTR